MFKNYKYALLLALFCSAQIPAQAGWSYNLFVNIASIAKGFYPLNMLLGGFDRLGEIAHELRTPVDNIQAQKSYPYASAYVEKQLKTAGINPDHVQMEDSKEMEYAASGFRKLVLPLSILEKTHATPSCNIANQAKATIAHEMGHLIRHSALKDVVALALTAAGTELCARYFPLMRTKVMGTILKTICSHMLFSAYAHFDEYQADGAAIEQLKNDRQALIDEAIAYLNQQVKYSREFIREKNDTLGLRLFYSPTLMACSHAVTDIHASNFSRANRLLKAAGIPCNQQLLAHLLKKQLVEHLSKDWQEKAKEIDTSPIIEILKQPREKIIADYGIDPGPTPTEQAKALDAIEIPYPLQPYGQ